jgi:hypothetical protein
MDRRLPRSRNAAGVALTALTALAILGGGCGGTGAPTQAPAPTPASPSPPTPPPAPTMSPTAEVRVFFVAGGTDPCGNVVPVVRKVAGPVSAEVALRELLGGPSPAEAAAGYSSLFGPATADALLGVVIVEGIARVSFRDLRKPLPNASSACGSTALLAALDATLAQLAGIRGARYSFGGDEAAFYEWLQMAPPD